MFENLKKYYDDKKKELLLKEVTNNLGKVVVDDEKIVCYVDKEELKRNNLKKVSYKFQLCAQIRVNNLVGGNPT